MTWEDPADRTDRIVIARRAMTESQRVLYLNQGDTVQVQLSGVESPIDYVNRSFGGFLIGR